MTIDVQRLVSKPVNTNETRPHRMQTKRDRVDSSPAGLEYGEVLSVQHSQLVHVLLPSGSVGSSPNWPSNSAATWVKVGETPDGSPAIDPATAARFDAEFAGSPTRSTRKASL